MAGLGMERRWACVSLVQRTRWAGWGVGTLVGNEAALVCETGMSLKSSENETIFKAWH